jgi:hypothetical protein
VKRVRKRKGGYRLVYKGEAYKQMMRVANENAIRMGEKLGVSPRTSGTAWGRGCIPILRLLARIKARAQPFSRLAGEARFATAKGKRPASGAAKQLPGVSGRYPRGEQ